MFFPATNNVHLIFSHISVKFLGQKPNIQILKLYLAYEIELTMLISKIQVLIS